MEQDCVCEKCGYRPRAGDRHEVIFDDTTRERVATESVLHVICYQCGYEWVE